MKKKLPFPPKPAGQGYRTFDQDGDLNLGHFEERLRGTDQGPPAKPGASIVKAGPGSSDAQLIQVIQKAAKDISIQAAWSGAVPPEAQYWYRERFAANLIAGSNAIATTATEFQVFSEVVPAGQTLIVLDFFPIVLRIDPANPSLFVEEPPYKYYGTLGCEISFSGRQVISADASLTSGALVTEFSQVHGTFIMNKRAFVEDPNYPMAMYAGPGYTVTVTYKFKDFTNNANITFANIPGVGTTLGLGVKLTGVMIPTTVMDKITEPRK